MEDYKKILIEIIIAYHLESLSGKTLVRKGCRAYDNYKVDELEVIVSDSYNKQITKYFGNEHWVGKRDLIRRWCDVRLRCLRLRGLYSDFGDKY